MNSTDCRETVKSLSLDSVRLLIIIKHKVFDID